MPLLKRIEKRISRKEKEDELGITDLKRKMKEMKEDGGDGDDLESDSDSNSDSDDTDDSDSDSDGGDSLSDEGGLKAHIPILHFADFKISLDSSSDDDEEEQAGEDLPEDDGAEAEVEEEEGVSSLLRACGYQLILLPNRGSSTIRIRSRGSDIQPG